MPVQVTVCEPRHCANEDKNHAYEVGGLLAKAGAVVICGGGSGVMAAARTARGSRSRCER